MLPDHRLIFCRFASIEPHPGSTVQGAWALSPECETVLDQFEGLAGDHYRRETVQILREGIPRLIPAMAYRRVATDRKPPPPAYLDLIRQGYEDFGLDTRLLEAPTGEQPLPLLSTYLNLWSALPLVERKGLLRHNLGGRVPPYLKCKVGRLQRNMCAVQNDLMV